MKQISKARCFALALALAPAGKAYAKRCSSATLKGTLSDKATGWIDGIGTLAGVNLDSFDGNENMTITGFASLNDTIVPNQETGTYTVKPDAPVHT